MVDANEGLSTVKPHRFNVLSVVCGQAIIELPARPDYAAPIHRADRDFAVKGAKPRQLFQDIGARQHAVDPGQGEAAHQALEECVAVSHSERVVAEGDFAARRVIGGEDQQLTVIACERATTPSYERVPE